MFLPILSLLTLSGSLLAQSSSHLVVMRHGEGEHNVRGVFSTLTKEEGGIDYCLTEKGRAEVRETAQRLLQAGFNRDTVSLVVVSPMQRTRETAQILADCHVCSKEVMRVDARLREPLANHWEDLVKESIPELTVHFSNWTEEVDVCGRAGGETSEEMNSRVHSIMQLMREQDDVRGHVIFVTHGAIVSAVSEIYGENVVAKTAEAKIFPFPR